MEKNNKILVSILFASLSLTLTACSDDDDNNNAQVQNCIRDQFGNCQNRRFNDRFDPRFDNRNRDPRNGQDPRFRDGGQRPMGNMRSNRPYIDEASGSYRSKRKQREENGTSGVSTSTTSITTQKTTYPQTHRTYTPPATNPSSHHSVGSVPNLNRTAPAPAPDTSELGQIQGTPQVRVDRPASVGTPDGRGAFANAMPNPANRRHLDGYQRTQSPSASDLPPNLQTNSQTATVPPPAPIANKPATVLPAQTGTINAKTTTQPAPVAPAQPAVTMLPAPATVTNNRNQHIISNDPLFYHLDYMEADERFATKYFMKFDVPLKKIKGTDENLETIYNDLQLSAVTLNKIKEENLCDLEQFSIPVFGINLSETRSKHAPCLLTHKDGVYFLGTRTNKASGYTRYYYAEITPNGIGETSIASLGANNYFATWREELMYIAAKEQTVKVYLNRDTLPKISYVNQRKKLLTDMLSSERGFERNMKNAPADFFKVTPNQCLLKGIGESFTWKVLAPGSFTLDAIPNSIEQAQGLAAIICDENGDGLANESVQLTRFTLGSISKNWSFNLSYDQQSLNETFEISAELPANVSINPSCAFSSNGSVNMSVRDEKVYQVQEALSNCDGTIQLSNFTLTSPYFDVIYDGYKEITVDSLSLGDQVSTSIIEGSNSQQSANTASDLSPIDESTRIRGHQREQGYNTRIKTQKSPGFNASDYK